MRTTIALHTAEVSTMELEVFDESKLHRIGIVCPRESCGTEVTFNLYTLTPTQIADAACPNCGTVLLKMIYPELPTHPTWLSLYRSLVTQPKDVSIRLYFKKD